MLAPLILQLNMHMKAKKISLINHAQLKLQNSKWKHQRTSQHLVPQSKHQEKHFKKQRNQSLSKIENH